MAKERLKSVKDLTGQRFGNLVVKEYTKERKHGSVVWDCECVCGKTLKVTSNHLLTGDVKSCGCSSKEMEGLTKGWKYVASDPLYTRYNTMKMRCYNSNNPECERYGAIGVTVCDRWLEPDGQGFLNFLEDMGPMPSKKHSVDRINPHGNYEPANCRWATPVQQSWNQKLSKRNRSGVQGVRWDDKTSTWRVRIQKDNKLLFDKYFKDFDQAVKTRRELEIKYYGENK